MRRRNLLLDALFPEHVVCALCNQEAIVGDDGFCDDCREAILRCPSGLTPPNGLDGLTAALLYTPAVEPAIHRFKYQRQVWLAPILADLIALPDDWRVDCIVPVPLHPLRAWLRMFNQSELLARALAQRYPIPVCQRLLVRTRYTAPQAQLDAARRATNLTGAFSASPRAKGRSILLVDDVTTTHHTLLHCAAALRKAGAKRVYAACVCLAGRDGRDATDR